MVRTLQKSVFISADMGWAWAEKLRSICGRSVSMTVQNELAVATTRIGAGASQILLVYIVMG